MNSKTVSVSGMRIDPRPVPADPLTCKQVCGAAANFTGKYANKESDPALTCELHPRIEEPLESQAVVKSSRAWHHDRQQGGEDREILRVETVIAVWQGVGSRMYIGTFPEHL